MSEMSEGFLMVGYCLDCRLLEELDENEFSKQ